MSWAAHAIRSHYFGAAKSSGEILSAVPDPYVLKILLADESLLLQNFSSCSLSECSSSLLFGYSSDEDVFNTNSSNHTRNEERSNPNDKMNNKTNNEIEKMDKKMNKKREKKTCSDSGSSSESSGNGGTSNDSESGSLSDSGSFYNMKETG